MPKYNLLDTETATLNDIFTNGKRYQVPDFQRDYSWKEEQWDDLWTDIIAIRNTKNLHYMGAIVLQDLENKQFAVIDGQQRLATLSIIALAIINKIDDLVKNGLKEETNTERKQRLTEQYIGEKDAVSLRYSNKLKLNENNEPFYKSYLVQLREPINPHKLSDSNKLLNKAFNFFTSKIKEFFGEKVTGEELADFLQNQIAEKLAFIQIVVKNDLDAYTVFETLNSRGIELSTSDLLKNYLLSLTSDSTEDKEQAKDQWNSIIEITGLDKFPEFLRYFWLSRYEIVRREYLFKALRKSIKTKQETFNLLDDLERYAAVYSALRNPNDELWQGRKQIRKHIDELKLFVVKQPFPLLMSAYFKFFDEDIATFETILRFCSVIAFRYNAIGNLDSKIQEEIFHNASKKIFEGKIDKPQQIAQELKGIYVDDERFENLFATKQLNTKSKKKLARYILFSLENQIAQTDRNYEESSATIEHILPENPNKDWENFFSEEEQANYVYRLGNFTLLEPTKNNECATKLFDEKKKIYQNSQYEMTKTIDYPEWKVTQVKLRQESLAKIAKSVWKISQISN
jgi:uncharacterized protein with ParB-like and HNH nuclease domain